VGSWMEIRHDKGQRSGRGGEGGGGGRGRFRLEAGVGGSIPNMFSSENLTLQTMETRQGEEMPGGGTAKLLRQTKTRCGCVLGRAECEGGLDRRPTSGRIKVQGWEPRKHRGGGGPEAMMSWLPREPTWPSAAEAKKPPNKKEGARLTKGGGCRRLFHSFWGAYYRCGRSRRKGLYLEGRKEAARRLGCQRPNSVLGHPATSNPPGSKEKTKGGEEGSGILANRARIGCGLLRLVYFEGGGRCFIEKTTMDSHSWRTAAYHDFDGSRTIRDSS